MQVMYIHTHKKLENEWWKIQCIIKVPKKGEKNWQKRHLFLSLSRSRKGGFYFSFALLPGQQLELRPAGSFLFRLRSSFSPLKHAWAGVGTKTIRDCFIRAFDSNLPLAGAEKQSVGAPGGTKHPGAHH